MNKQEAQGRLHAIYGSHTSIGKEGALRALCESLIDQLPIAGEAVKFTDVIAAIRAAEDENAERGRLYPQMAEEHRKDKRAAARTIGTLEFFGAGCHSLKGWPQSQMPVPTIPERKRLLLQAIDHEAAQRQRDSPLTGKELRNFRVLRVLLGGKENVSVESTIEKLAPSFQDRVAPWMQACFGQVISSDTQERNHRFLEESLELVQACGCTRSEAHQLVDYVFGRPVGERLQEAGGVMVTLAALCLAQKLDMHAAGEIELARIWQKVDIIRAKQAAKPKHSPLPQAATASSMPDPLGCLKCVHPDCGRYEGPHYWECRAMREPGACARERGDAP